MMLLSKITTFVSLLLLFLSINVLAIEKNQKSQTIQLLFSSDLADISDRRGYAQLAKLKSKLKKQHSSPLFFLFGGGVIGPSPMSSFDKGSHIIDILNLLEPDAMGVTKREFIFNEDELSLRSFEAGFPVIVTNVLEKDTKNPLDGLLSSLVINRGGINVAVLSTVETSIKEEYLLSRVDIVNQFDAIQSEARKLRSAGVDVIILLYSRYDELYTSLAESDVVDLSILTDTSLSETWNMDVSKPKNYINNKHVALDRSGHALVIEYDTKRRMVVEHKLVDLASVSTDPEIEKQIDEYSRRLDRLLNIKVGTFNFPFTTRFTSVRSHNNTFANIVADAMKNFVASDIALINGGVIRGNRNYVTREVLTRRTISTELPFRSRIVLLKVKGTDIVKALNNGLSKLDELKGRFLHVSGMSYRIKKVSEVEHYAIDVKIGDDPINLQRYYTLATSDYIARGGDGFNSFTAYSPLSIGVRKTPLISEVLINYIQSNNADIHVPDPRILVE